MFCSQASTLWFIWFIGILCWCMYRKSKVEMNRLHWLWKWCNYSPLNCFIAIFTFTGLPIVSFLPELCKQYCCCSCTDATLHLTLIKIQVYIFWIMQTILLLHWLMPICISHWSKLESISSELLVATLFGGMWLLVRSCQTVSWKAFMHDLDFMNEWTIFSSRCS